MFIRGQNKNCTSVSKEKKINKIQQNEKNKDKKSINLLIAETNTTLCTSKKEINY